MEFKIEKASKNVYEIKKDGAMNVPVRIYANEYIIKNMQKDRTLMQAVNTAALPSIVKNMLVMPDGHEGYGFPVGGVAAFDAENGIISPGAIGFDINCLHPDTKVCLSSGAWIRIKDMVETPDVISFDGEMGSEIRTKAVLLLSKKERGTLFRISTEFGGELLVTGDHPILTRSGMVNAGNLRIGMVAIRKGFYGTEWTRPIAATAIGEAIISSALRKVGVGEGSGSGILKFLRRRGLTTLRRSDPKFELLIKLFGMLLGTGTLQEGDAPSIIYGRREDLDEIKRDLAAVGFRASIHKHTKGREISAGCEITKPASAKFSLRISSKAFAVMMAALGAPVGDRSKQEYLLPDWLFEIEPWQKRLFLAAYFGAELTKPMAIAPQSFGMPSLGVNKSTALVGNAYAFLGQIRDLLESLGIRCAQPVAADEYLCAEIDSNTIDVKLSIDSEAGNLIKLFGNIGYAYNSKKQEMASLAALYLTYLKEAKSGVLHVKKMAKAMYAGSIGMNKIAEALDTRNTAKPSTGYSMRSNCAPPRACGAESFDEFYKWHSAGGGYVYDRITGIEEVAYNGQVYDLSVGHTLHNFVANGTVVSNCGVRLIRTNLEAADVRPKISQLMDSLFKNVPSGVGSKIRLGFTRADLDKVSVEGVDYVIKKGYGFADDLERIEENGRMEGADPKKVSAFAKARGEQQLGTLGAGNHFLEVQRVDNIFDEGLAKAFGLHKGQIVVMLHSGSRGFGHQICSDYLEILSEYQRKNNISLPDPELAYTYVGSKEAEDYLAAMRSAVNFAFANRQIMTHSIRKSFAETFEKSADSLGMELLYDVAHNIAKLEEHDVDGKRMKLFVHRKGATRAFGPGSKDIPRIYREYGQPVIIPGSMGTASYVLAGRKEAMLETFGSSCHGSGRTMSRHQAIRDIPMSKTFRELEEKDITIRVRSRKLISEEAMEAYKNVDEVVASIEGANISKIVAKMVPMGVAKG